MSKIGLIIGREYKTRVAKKSFIILTFLTPLLLVGMIALIMYMSAIKDDKVKSIVVVDQTGLYHNVLQDNESYTFRFSDEPIDSLRANQKSDGFFALLLINNDLSKDSTAATMYSDMQINVELKSYVSSLLNKYVENQNLAAFNIPNLKEMVDQSKSDINLKTIKWGKDGQEKQTSAELALIIGMLTAMLIFMFISIYGSQVMSGVVQEKSNRIVEVIISSVKPFELMMGKIVGIALVGLTQFLLWVVLTGGILLALTTIFGQTVDADQQKQLLEMGQTSSLNSSMLGSPQMQEFIVALQGINIVQLLVLFVVYFLGGYLLYASLFAAVGSAVDNETDSNQFVMPIMIPIMFAYFAGIYAARNPDGPLAFWCSIVPFTSPIVMMIRLPFDVPIWQIALSLSILVLSFIASTWISGKIYRTGILMYGKKVTWKELWKWLKY
ncbi:MAG: ABC transporter permease [Paludibacter sp.]|jgi:ABC-2 type transport system permease protein|nr:ABC transporter permease [Paludibacter sp.]